jgi:hypothetical protein
VSTTRQQTEKTKPPVSISGRFYALHTRVNISGHQWFAEFATIDALCLTVEEQKAELKEKKFLKK